jgi:NADPH-dependent ferric siderophore reductase
MSVTAPAHAAPVPAPARKPRTQITLSVVRSERLTPHIVRVVLGGPGFDEFESNDKTDKYVKILFTDPDGHPVTRTYTVRQVNPVEKTISIDFVVHGDEGLAGPWAAAAQPGDIAVISGPGGGYAPDPAADWHLLVGDESALPAIASALDALPETARGVAFIESHSHADILELAAPLGVEVHWLLRGDARAGEATLLADAVAGHPWPEGSVQIFAHGERGAMKKLRDVFKERGVTRAQLSLSGYWAFGRTEDRFQAEKREPIGVIESVSD